MKQIYIYISIFIIISLAILNNNEEGFQVHWYNNEYFLMPLLLTIFIIGPLLYVFYSIFLRGANKVLTS